MSVSINDLMHDYMSGGNLAHQTGLSIALGNIDGVASTYKFGKNNAVGTSYETIWEQGGLYQTPSTATVATIVSNNAQDDSGVGTGAHTIRIAGLDENFMEQEETITMDGTTPVNSVNTYIRLNRMWVQTAGSGGAAAGTITATVDSLVVASMTEGNNQTQVTHYTIPANKAGYVATGFISTGQGKEVEGSIWVRLEGGVYRNVANASVYQNWINVDFAVPFYIPAKADIEMRGKTATGTVAATASLTIILVDQE